MAIVPVRAQDLMSCGQLIRHCEIREIVSRVATAVIDFFKYIAYMLLTYLCPCKDSIVCVLPYVTSRDVMQYAKECFTPNMGWSNRGKIITIIRKIPGEQRADIMEMTIRVLRPLEKMERGRVDLVAGTVKEFQDFSKNQRMRAIRYKTTRFTSKERKEVVQSFPQLFIQEVQRDVVSDRIIIIPREERDEVIQCAAQFITPEMTCGTKLCIIDSIEEILQGDRREFTQVVLQLITPAMNDVQRIALISRIKEISKEERAEIVEGSTQLITSAMAYRDRMVIIKYVIEIPRGERTEVAQGAAQLITPEMDFRDRLLMIEIVEKIPARLRLEVLRAIGERVTPEMNIAERLSLIETITTEHRIGIRVDRIFERVDRILGYFGI